MAIRVRMSVSLLRLFGFERTFWSEGERPGRIWDSKGLVCALIVFIIAPYPIKNTKLGEVPSGPNYTFEIKL